MWKTLRRSELIQKTGSYLIALLIKLLANSIRWSVNMPVTTKQLLNDGKPIILIFWHNRILSMTAGWNNSRNITLLRSPHRDGLLIGRAIGHLGYKTVAGSSNKNGSAGLRKLLEELRKGNSIGITPDGPRGPRMRLAMGTIAAARLSNIPIIPVAWNAENRLLLKTWDKMILARPFTKGVFFFGEPISIPKRLTPSDEENWRLNVEVELNKVSEESELYFQHKPIQPASKKSERKGTVSS